MGPEHDVVPRGATMRVVELRGLIDQRVEPDFLEVGARSLRAGMRLGTHAPSVIEARGVEGKISAAMRRDHLQLRMPIEHAAENQMRKGDGGLSRIADHIR